MLTELTAPQRQHAFERFRQMRAHLEQDVLLAQIAAEAAVSLRTAQRWVRRYRECGLAGLVRTSRTDRGRHRRLDDDLRQLAEGLALQRPPLGSTAIQADSGCARGGQRADVYPERGLPVGVVAEGFAAAQHSERLFLPVEL